MLTLLSIVYRSVYIRTRGAVFECVLGIRDRVNRPEKAPLLQKAQKWATPPFACFQFSTLRQGKEEAKRPVSPHDRVCLLSRTARRRSLTFMQGQNDQVESLLSGFSPCGIGSLETFRMGKDKSGKQFRLPITLYYRNLHLPACCGLCEGR